ncbi:MAG TPA: helix-turn-helix domain-containing protein [Actinomycetota bacterium]|nr:helix-turn-helix domain-containing protein [Actinomycetota bacterium]
MGSKREKAAATRRKIIAAAHEEFVSRGYHGATIASIAESAGVAVQTIYFVFHTKADLISAVIDFAVMGGEDPSGIPQATEWWEAMVVEQRADEALRIFIRGAGPLFERASAVSEILRAASLTDEEVRKTYQGHEELRRSGFRDVIDVIATKGRLRDGLDPESATDLFLLFVGDSTYQVMTVEYGWAHERWIEWLCEAVPQILLEIKPGRRR